MGARRSLRSLRTVICRGGLVVGGPSGALTTPLARQARADSAAATRLQLAAFLATIVLGSIVLKTLANMLAISPLVESDYCYLLTAADRLVAGQGLTCTPPVAPHQPWSWQYDWGFLTHWPIGYSLLVAAIRASLGLTTLEACAWISAVACSAAFFGWFAWIRRIAPRGLTGFLLAAVGALAALPPTFLINPSTDAILVAVLPFILLLTAKAAKQNSDGPLLAMAGLLSGSLFWFRYASVFVPLAIGLYLLVICLRRRVRFAHLAMFTLGAALPVAGLLLINRIYAPSTTLAAQLNLGDTMGFDGSLDLLARAWWTFTNLGYFDYRSASHWLFATSPLAVVAAAAHSKTRRTLVEFVRSPSVSLSLFLTMTLLAMLIAASTFFHGKFDYVALDRYYLPIRPLYFVLFVTPIAAIPRRLARVALCLVLVTAGWWSIRQDWVRSCERWSAAHRPSTPYGQWSQCFQPGAAELFTWLREHNAPELVVVSNFHEYITLETQIPALPIPADRATLDQWTTRIRTARNVPAVRTLFVLHPDNLWRSNWIPAPQSVIETFALQPAAAPDPLDQYLFGLPPSEHEARATGLSERGAEATRPIRTADGPPLREASRANPRTNYRRTSATRFMRG